MVAGHKKYKGHGAQDKGSMKVAVVMTIFVGCEKKMNGHIVWDFGILSLIILVWVENFGLIILWKYYNSIFQQQCFYHNQLVVSNCSIWGHRCLAVIGRAIDGCWKQMTDNGSLIVHS